MKTLRRYLVKEVLASTLLVLAALLMLYIIIDFLNELGDSQTRRTFVQMMLISATSIPMNVYVLLPIAALLGSLFALSQLNANSEYTVMRASGASVTQIALPLAGLGLAFALIGFVLAEAVIPAAETLSARARAYGGAPKNVTQRFKSGFWFREGSSFINIGSVLPDKTLSNIRVFEFDRDGNLLTLLRAESATHEGETKWTLRGVAKQSLTRAAIKNETSDVLAWQSVLTPNMLSVLQLQPDRLTASSLWEYTQHLRRNNQKSSRFEAALWSKLLYPLACCVLIVLAIPFAQGSRRAGGVGLRIFIGILLGLVFILCNRLFSFLGQLYDWPPALAALLPYLLFITLTVVMIVRNERR